MIPQLVVAALGVWLMASPAVLGYGGTARADHIVLGSLLATFGIIAATEATRGLRRLNQALGLWLVVGGALLGHPLAAALNGLAAGAAAVGLSFLGGRVSEDFGGGWSMLFRSGREEEPPPKHPGSSPSLR